MKTTLPLTGFGLMAERHWREFLPNRVAHLEREGTLQEMLYEAQERTLDEMESITQRLESEQGLTVQQAHDQAWEMIKENYILLPPEDLQ